MCYDLNARLLRHPLIWFDSVENVWRDGQVEPDDVKVIRLWHLRWVLNDLVRVHVQLGIHHFSLHVQQFASFHDYWIYSVENVNY